MAKSDEDEDPEEHGPLLLYLADTLAKPQQVYASTMLGRNFKIKNIVYAVFGAVFGAALGFPFTLLLGSMYFVYWGAIFMAGIMIVISNSTPLKGEKFGTWIRLMFSARAGMVEVDGERCKLYLDIAPINIIEGGECWVQPATEPVAAGAVNSRGLFYDIE